MGRPGFSLGEKTDWGKFRPVTPDPTGLWNSGAFNFSVFKALLNTLHCGDKFMVKSLLKAPAPQRLTIMKNNK